MTRFDRAKFFALFVGSVVLTCDLARGQVAYHWTISASDTDPYANTAPFASGIQTSYLWLASCDLPAPTPDGIHAAEFGLVSSNPANTIVTFQPNGDGPWLNGGDETNLLLSVPGCPCGPVVAGTILTDVTEPGSLCLGPSNTERMFAVDCTQDTGLWEISSVGLDFGGGSCNTVATGACCLPDGSCTDGIDVAECEAAGGIFQGEATACSTDLCASLGACCYADGSCEDGIDESACLAAGGDFQGLGTACATVQCSVLLGTCCYDDGTCVDGVEGVACRNAGGVFRAGATCGTSSCTPLEEPTYFWTVSASAESPDVHFVPVPPVSIVRAYLWLQCCLHSGMSAAEFGLVSSLGPILAFTPRNGFLNVGSATDLLLAVGGCPCGPIVAGEILMFVTQPGTVCIGPSASTGAKQTVACGANPPRHAVEWIGLGVGVSPCAKGFGCVPVSLEPSNWSRIKAMYR